MAISSRIAFTFTLLLTLGACAQDKVMHFGAGAAASAVVTHHTGDPMKGCMAALALGVAKEAWDATGRGNVEAADALATGLGCSLTYRF